MYCEERKVNATLNSKYSYRGAATMWSNIMNATLRNTILVSCAVGLTVLAHPAQARAKKPAATTATATPAAAPAEATPQPGGLKFDTSTAPADKDSQPVLQFK